MIFKESANLLFAIKCRLCNNEFVYCVKSRDDYRCYNCKKKQHMTVEDVQKELKEMDKEEVMSFLEDIKEYEKEHGKIIYEEDEEDDIL